MTKNKSNYRPAVPPETKRDLYREAGNKCANPGCPNRLVELHHIHEWHVYQTHDAKHMIAICPTCHGHAHYGEMKIEESTIRSWKKARPNPSNTGYLYIEPGPPPRILMGRIYWNRKDGDGAIVFQLSARNQVSFRVIPGNILLASLVVSDPVGNAIVELRENHLIHARREGVKFEQRPGQLRVTVPATDEFVSCAMIDNFQTSYPLRLLVKEERITLIDIQVIDIGTVQVEGVWIEGDRAVVANADFVYIHRPGIGFNGWTGYDKVRGDKDLSNLPLVTFDGPLEISVMQAFFKIPAF
ncbi:MAG: HNH endonuclease [Verrucomicrobia bacterium]|nr:HNH endonuclease [Verrucomicrobiota bacterium]